MKKIENSYIILAKRFDGRDNMDSLFYEGLIENDVSKLLAAPKSDLHNHSSMSRR